ncbi:WD repeat-containing protein 49-like [Lingula anatina]|uniref:WD repeat-containing protein 49-like n=1 Tax=Lingula anatina TaxID=7574 RepID=A0A1S3JWS0_LINAN|nr:WD repeat-containing protein 49-like [Lingula anatina]|eukprot:XP_013414484.2 WD repeat-containing protein 49-like [Lingula anatina]
MATTTPAATAISSAKTKAAPQAAPEPEPDTSKKMLDQKMENRLNIRDLEQVQDIFMADGDGYDNRLSLNREQFCEALSRLLTKGSRQDYAELFDKIDVTKEGQVDWDKFASHMLLEFYEKDDRVKSTQVPQWKDLKTLPSPHKETIQKIAYLKNINRYIAISKEGCVSMWDPSLKLQRTIKTGTESCRQRDLWMSHFVPLQNINKIALAFTSKEIAFYDMSSNKLEFNCQYKVQGLEHTPLCLDYWFNPKNTNEAVIVWGDVGGCVNALLFSTANIALFERPTAPAGEKQETTLNIQLKEISRTIDNREKAKYKNARYIRHHGHSEWVRQVKYAPNLDAFISVSTSNARAIVIGWIEKGDSLRAMKTTAFHISQGVNGLDYHEGLNLIATAGVNHQVCLWNPYVVSKPNGVLRGHMASVIQVQFNTTRGQLISFSKDKVLRIWDVQLQVCIQRLAGMFPKGPEVYSVLYLDEIRNRLFITFNYQLTLMEMKAEVKNRILSHEKPICSVIYNSLYNQVISSCQAGTVVVWMIDTGQKVKQFTNTHGTNEVTALALDQSETRLYTGSTDGTVKIWDFNGHCYHTLDCSEGHPADIGQIIVLKRNVLVVGWARHITIFRQNNLKDFHVLPSDWKGGQEHQDDILTACFSPPNRAATASYDGEIVIWNMNSEHASKHLNQRAKKVTNKNRRSTLIPSRASRELTREGTFESVSPTRNPPTPRNATTPRNAPTPGTAPTPLSRASPQRTKSRMSVAAISEDQTGYEYAVTRVLFLEARKTHSASGTANLVSCGGNGWVRFWNTSTSAGTLMGEFVSHPQAASVIMATDQHNQYLVTGDVDGNMKVWNISEYCIRQADDVVTNQPPMTASWQPHVDVITSLVMCERNERLLVVSASMDCSVQLWDIYGNLIGVFGQEDHWKIEPYVPKMEVDEETKEEEEEFADTDMIEPDADSHWEPEESATDQPESYRFNTWDKTCLGKTYQETRTHKRERRQPKVMPNLPYLHWERTGDPPAGPFAALEMNELQELNKIDKPDFIAHPHKYFSERSNNEEQSVKLPALAESLKTPFDEKTLFYKAKYILDYETRMKQYHKTVLEGGGKKQKLGGGKIAIPTLPNQSQAPPSRAPAKPQKLKPIQQSRGSSQS